MGTFEKVILALPLMATLRGTVYAQPSLAPAAPMGWNSWDSFGTTATEVFNPGDAAEEPVSINREDVGLGRKCAARDLRARKDIGAAGNGEAFRVEPHAEALYRLTRVQ